MSWIKIKEDNNTQDQQRLMVKLAERVKVFKGFTTGELAELLCNAQKSIFATDASIIKEESACTHMYIILEGEVAVTKKVMKRKVELARLHVGDSFGEMSMVDNNLRSATVIALSPCVMLRIGSDLMNLRPETAMKFYRNITKILTDRLRKTSDQLVWRI